MNTWADATLPISNESLVWPGDDPVRINPTVQISKGDMCNESRITIGSHCTTHIDAPYHFDDAGLRLDQLDPNLLVGPAWVLESAARRVVGLSEARSIPRGECTRVLLKTRNSEFVGLAPFRKDYVGLAPEAAQHLVDQGCKLVGIDYYSICPFEDLETTHRTLLCNGVAIIESLVLKEIAPGPVDLIALPLKIAGGDACPARVLIRRRT